MTVEELNVKITADAGSFREEIALVNRSLDELRSKARMTGIEVVSAFGGMMNAASYAETKEVKYETAAVGEVAENSTAPAAARQPDYFNTLAPAARVQSFRRGETVVGVLNNGSAAGSTAQPIQINTTVELDGDVLGEAVSFYNARQRRITNE